MITAYNTDELIETYSGVHKSVANVGRTFESFDTNTTINSDFNRRDYDYFRPSSRIPTKPKDIIKACMNAYDSIGLIHNVIDLMSEFACDGIHLTHQVPSVQKFYQKWFDRVDGYSVSERFLNYLYRTGNIFCLRKEGKIDKKTTKKWQSAFGLTDFIDFKPSKNTIPSEYIFYNPLQIELQGNGYDSNTTKFGINISVNDRNNILGDSNINSLFSVETINSLRIGNTVPLDMDNLLVYYYKKDDWEKWAKPMIFSILNSLVVLEKMHLADISALDGAISNIRLWRIGIIDTSNPTASILPTRTAINKLKSLLHNRGTGGVLDLIWGPELDFKETSTSVHQFLGKEKYAQVMMEIFGGLGIPSVLSGGSKESGSGAFMSLQTLIKRLEYGRRLLIDFWTGEIKRVQLAMGFAKPARIKFSSNLLNDQGIKNKLLLDLVDRNILSIETLRKELEFDDDVESARLNREEKRRDNDNMPDKAGPYHNPQGEQRLKEILLQGGGVTPSEVGVELMPKKNGEKTLLELNQKMSRELAKIGKSTTDIKKPDKINGRPLNSKDKNRRKQKTLVKSIFSSAFLNNFLWANAAQKNIADLLNQSFLDIYKKKNMRSLSSEEHDNSENLKFMVLSHLNPFEEITKDKVYNILVSKKNNPEIISIAKLLCKQFIDKNGREPILDELKQIQATAYAVHKEELWQS